MTPSYGRSGAGLIIFASTCASTLYICKMQNYQKKPSSVPSFAKRDFHSTELFAEHKGWGAYLKRRSPIETQAISQSRSEELLFGDGW